MCVNSYTLCMTYKVEDNADHNDEDHHGNDRDDDGIPRDRLAFARLPLRDGQGGRAGTELSLGGSRGRREGGREREGRREGVREDNTLVGYSNQSLGTVFKNYQILLFSILTTKYIVYNYEQYAILLYMCCICCISSKRCRGYYIFISALPQCSVYLRAGLFEGDV